MGAFVKRFLLFLLVACPTPSLAAENGWFGLAYHTGVGWTLNVEEAWVALVVPGSPGARAGVSVGDVVVDLEGCVIPGCGAYKAKDLMQKKVGETLHMRLKRKDGTEYSVAIVAEQEPARSQ